MWPKALGQLVELAPHLARLLPVADRFLNSKTANEEASRKAMEQMAEGLRGDLGHDLGQLTASHAGLYRQLNDQSVKLDDVAAGVLGLRADIEAMETRQQAYQKRLSLLVLLAGFGLTLLGVACVLAGMLLYSLHHLH